jgi:hypothetical protein
MIFTLTIQKKSKYDEVKSSKNPSRTKKFYMLIHD